MSQTKVEESLKNKIEVKPEEAVNALTKLLNEKENIIRGLYVKLEALQGKLNEKENAEPEPKE